MISNNIKVHWVWKLVNESLVTDRFVTFHHADGITSLLPPPLIHFDEEKKCEELHHREEVCRINLQGRETGNCNQMSSEILILCDSAMLIPCLSYTHVLICLAGTQTG